MMAMEQQRRAWARRGCEVRSPQVGGRQREHIGRIAGWLPLAADYK